ncbi:MAG: hypothetical protein AAFQ98_07370 [Bacteroidota bacterium]
MKTIFTICMALLGLHGLYAQPAKGDFTLGGSVNAQWSWQDSRVNTLAIDPRIGYFITPQLLVEGELSGGVTDIELGDYDDAYWRVGIGASTTYYLVEGTWSPLVYVHGGLRGYGGFTEPVISGLPSFQYGAGLGSIFWLQPKLALEGVVKAEFDRFGFGIYPQIGFKYLWRRNAD